MKNFVFLFTLFLTVCSCKNEKSAQEESFDLNDDVAQNYSSYGSQIDTNTIFKSESMLSRFEEMKDGDTLSISFTGKVNDVCKAKGCWMKVALTDDKETMVKFKDYGFFVPKDIENDSVIVQGKAYVSETSVEELRHLAEDAGKSEEEIASINSPKKTYKFLADGVLIKK